MRKIFLSIVTIISVLLCGCLWTDESSADNILLTYEIDTVGSLTASVVTTFANVDAVTSANNAQQVVDAIKQQTPIGSNHNNFPANEIVSFAKTLIGTPYVYGSTDPHVGFDCSGFITYVFTHFGYKVPRSSVEFTNRGIEIPVNSATVGDLILFTGTDSLTRIVGHMGIVIENTDGLKFIHSSSGKAQGVTISPLQGYYQNRFVKVISIKNGI